MRTQLEGDVELLRPILCTSGRVRYAFVERSRIAKKAFYTRQFLLIDLRNQRFARQVA